jgi:hypothetical protein
MRMAASQVTYAAGMYVWEPVTRGRGLLMQRKEGMLYRKYLWMIQQWLNVFLPHLLSYLPVFQRGFEQHSDTLPQPTLDALDERLMA